MIRDNGGQLEVHEMDKKGWREGEVHGRDKKGGRERYMRGIKLEEDIDLVTFCL